jgi:hypothetical protein
LGVSQNIIVPESEHAKPFSSEIVVSHYIVPIVCVLTAVDLDNQLSSETCKIDNVWTNGNLPLELESIEAMSA